MKSIPDPFDVDECNRRCHNAMLNTPVGKWLAAACREIESLRLQLSAEQEKPKELPKARICPKCDRVTFGGLHLRDNGERCDMVYGRRGWRQLGEYDT